MTWLDGILTGCAVVGLLWTYLDAKQSAPEERDMVLILASIHNKLDAIAHDMGTDYAHPEVWTQ